MADSILRLKVESQEYDNKLKQAAQGLTRYADECRKVGGTLEVVEKETLDYVRALGQMDTTSRTATGKLAEMKKTFVELSAQYKQMTDAEKASPFGKALAASLDQLKPRIIDTKNQLDEINKSIIGASSGGGGLFSGLGDKMSGALQVFGGNMLTKAAGAVANLGSEIFISVQQGIELARQGEGIRIAFERLGRGDILDGLRKATHGTVTDIELMKAAVKFNDFKLPLDELGTMLAFAQQKAKDTGQSVDFLVESIVNGLGRKSLMILDNLGLSATEVKDRMAETGDMTKAVGDIIREQMAKAGDYVETAAERATKANVDLTNAMTALGDTLQPLTDASNSLWNSIKVGALNALNTAVKPLIQALAEAGALGSGARATAGFNRLGGGSKVDRMIGRLGNGKTAGSYSIYQQQLGEFDKYINNKRFQIAAYGGDNSGVAQSAKAKLQAELDGALKMRAEYVKRAQELHNKVPSPFEPATTSGGATGGSGRSGSATGGGSGFDLSKIAFDPNKALLSATKVADTGPSEIWKAITQGAKESTSSVEDLTAAFEKLNAVQGVTAGEGVKDSSELSDKWRNAGTAISAVGSAMSQIEDPAAKVMGTVAQAIATIALTYASSLKGTFTPWDWIAGAAAGLATMISTISAIHSATGYARGGVIKAANGAAIPGTFTVPGTTYSNDQIPAMLNAGETVLTRAQAGNIASQLQGAGGNINLNGVLSGENIFLSADRYARRSGRGELVTFHR